MSAEIRSLAAARADRENDNGLVSPAEMLRDAARALDAGEETATSALVLFLDAGVDGETYDVNFRASNMRCSEMLALLEVAKRNVLTAMGID